MIVSDGEELAVRGDELGENGPNQAMIANPLELRRHRAANSFGHCDPLIVGL